MEKKIEPVLELRGFLELNFRFIDSHVLFDLFGETHLREVSKLLLPLPVMLAFGSYNQK